MHSAGLELKQLTYNRIEDNLIRLGQIGCHCSKPNQVFHRMYSNCFLDFRSLAGPLHGQNCGAEFPGGILEGNGTLLILPRV